jgi:quercetin dioxygenase-like cupin family protein
MKIQKALPIVLLLVLWSGTALAQDPVAVDPGHYQVLVDNASVRVLKIGYGAGEKSPMHQHPDSLVLLLADAKARFTMPEGKSEDVSMPNETSQYSPAGSHSPANIGPGRIDGILVEFKAAAPGTATIPASRPGLTTKVLADGPRGTAFRMTADSTFQEPAGTKHDYDQVVIALGSAQMSLSIDGKPAKTTWSRGDVQFIGRGVQHESKNVGTEPVDFVIVAIR